MWCPFDLAYTIKCILFDVMSIDLAYTIEENIVWCDVHLA